MKILVTAIITILIVYALSALTLLARHDAQTQNVVFGLPFPHIIDIPAWERKIDVTGEAFKIGLITDTHLDTKRNLKPDGTDIRFIPVEYQKMMDDFTAGMKTFDPAFMVHLGDVIEGTNINEDLGMEEVALIKTAMDRAGKPVYWAIGNHDLRSVSRRKFHESLGIDYTDKVFDEGSYRFIILDANYRAEGVPNNALSGDYVPGYVPYPTQTWLREVLDTDKHVYIFMHHTPVSNLLTEKSPVKNAVDFMQLLSDYNVDGVFSGHIEKRFHRAINGVNYFTLPGIKKSPKYQGAFYELRLLGSEPDISMYYQAPGTTDIVQEPFVVDGKMIDQNLRPK